MERPFGTTPQSSCLALPRQNTWLFTPPRTFELYLETGIQSACLAAWRLGGKRPASFRRPGSAGGICACLFGGRVSYLPFTIPRRPRGPFVV
jgi:hypothetical protein